MTDTDPVTLNYNGHPIRVVVADGVPWFVVNDICRAFSVFCRADGPHGAAAVRMVAPEDQALRRVRTAGGLQATRMVTERGMYVIVRPFTEQGLGQPRLNAPDEETHRAFRAWVSGALPALLAAHAAGRRELVAA